MLAVRARNAIVSLVAAGLVLSACSSGSTGSGGTPDATDQSRPGELLDRSPGGTLVFGSDQELTGFNTNTSKHNGTAAKNVVENLFYYAVKANPDFTLDYVGLEGEPKVVSERPQVVEWTIRKDAVWSDGDPVTTADITYFFETQEAKDPALVEPEENPKGYVHDVASHVGYDQITKLEAVDDKTFRATFEPLYADFRGLWFDIPQAKFLKSQPGGWDDGLNDEPGPSAGPYLFKEWKKGESLTLVQNPLWWGEVKPTLESIIFRFLPESRTQEDALVNREVDMIYPQPQPDLIAEVARLSDVTSEIGFGPSFEHLTFNLQNEHLKQVEVRRAIAHAVDRNAIVDALVKAFTKDAKRLDNRVLMENQPGFKANGKEYQQVDREKAVEQLTNGGYTRGADGVFAKGGRRLSLRLATTSGNGLREQQVELIKNQLAQVGIEIRIDNSPTDPLFDVRLPSGDFDIVNFAWIGTPFPLSASQQIYETGSNSNFGRYSNKEFDRLAKEASSELDEEKRLELADKEDVEMWKDLPSLPLYQKPTFLAVRSNFVNIVDNSTNEGPFFNAQAWGLRATKQ